jgi:hypothetical protein
MRLATRSLIRPEGRSVVQGLPAIWGATPDEVARTYPCDELAPDADRMVRAVSSGATAPDVFRWLRQLRVAPYSYDWIDNWGRQSPRELTPGLENLEIGQRMVIIMELLEFEENEHLTFKICVGKKFWGHVGSTYRLVTAAGWSTRWWSTAGTASTAASPGPSSRGPSW